MKTALFYVYLLTYGFSFLFYSLFGKQPAPLVAAFRNAATALLMIWIPGAIALIYIKKEKMELPFFKFPNRLASVSALLLLAGLIFTILVQTSPKEMSFSPLVLGIFAAIALFSAPLSALFLLGQELFWRGYLYEKLKNQGILKASLLIGFFWGLQMSGFYFFETEPRSWKTVILPLLLALSQSPLLFWVREKGGSVASAALFYAVTNYGIQLAAISLKETSSLWFGARGLVWVALFALFSFWVLFLEKRKRVAA